MSLIVARIFIACLLPCTAFAATAPAPAPEVEAESGPVDGPASDPVVGQVHAEVRSTVAGGLEDVLKSVTQNNAQVQEALGDVEIARAQLQRAQAATFPRGEAIFLGAPIFEETGDAQRSNSNLHKWGPFLQGGAQLVQPLFTFGQLAGYKNAAENQITARTELANVKRLAVVQTAKEFYYGYQMARELEKLVEGTISFLEEAVTAAEESSKKQSKDAVKPHDLARLRVALDDLRQKKLLASQSVKTASQAVQWISGGYIEPRPEPLSPQTYRPEALEEYAQSATKLRPELKALAAGKVARLSLRDAKASQSNPTVFVGAFGSAAWSPVRQKQHSVFALDQFNRFQGGAALGLRFDLEWARHKAEAAEESAEYMKLEATERYAKPGIQLEVKKAYWELEQAREGLVIAERRKATAKKWFVGSAMGWSVGVTEAKNLLEALQGDAESKKNYIETVYAFNIALGKLSQAVGREISDLKY